MSEFHFPFPTQGLTAEDRHENQGYAFEKLAGFFERAGVEFEGSLPEGDRPIVLAYDHDDATDPFYAVLATLRQREEKTFIVAAKDKLEQPVVGRLIEQMGVVWTTRPERDADGNKVIGGLALGLGNALAEGMHNTPSGVALIAPESGRKEGVINPFSAGAVLAASRHSELAGDGQPTNLVIAAISGNRLGGCLSSHDGTNVVVKFGEPHPIGAEVMEWYRVNPRHEELIELRETLRGDMLQLVNDTEMTLGLPLSVMDDSPRQKGVRDKVAARIGGILSREN